MLTGPVTILAWSFVRDDQPIADTARQVALAIRDEAVDLDRPASRSSRSTNPPCGNCCRCVPPTGPRTCAGRSTRSGSPRPGSGLRTQIHTHLCYSEFGDIVDAINDLDADVTSVEAARSKLEFLDDLDRVRYRRGIGPGVYDIHSPRVPTPTRSRTPSLGRCRQSRATCSGSTRTAA